MSEQNLKYRWTALSSIIPLRTYIIVAVIAVGCWVFASLNLATIVISLFLIYRAIDRTADVKIFDSKLLRLVITPFFYALILQITIVSSWAVSRNFPLDRAPLATLVVLVVSILFLKLFTRPSRAIKHDNTATNIGLPDYSALIVCLVMFLLLAVAPVARSGTQVRGSVVSIITGGADDSAHLAMVNDSLQFNRGIFRHSDALGHLRIVGEAEGYPTGWSAANASIIKSFYPSIKTGAESLDAYIISKLFWFLVLVFLFVRFAFTLYRLMTQKTTYTLAASIWITCGILLFSYLFLIDSFLEGFYTFIPQLITILLLGMGLLQVVATSLKSPLQFQDTILFLAILCIAGSLPWILMLPAACLGVLLVLLDQARRASYKKIFVEIMRSILRYLPLYILLGLALLVQLYVSAGPSSSNSFLDSVLIGGGIGKYSSSFYAFVLVGVGIALATFKRPAAHYIRALLSLVVAILLLATLIYVVQLARLPDNQYYYYKVLNTFTVVAIPLSLAGYAIALTWLGDHKDKTISLALSVILPIIAVLFIGLNSTFNPIELTSFHYALGYRQSSTLVNDSIYKTLEHNAKQVNYSNDEYVLYYQPKYSVQNYFSTMVVKSNKPASECFDKVFSALLSNTDYSTIQTAIKVSCNEKYHFRIVTDSSHVNELRAADLKVGLANRVNIVSFEDTIKQ